MLKDRQMILSNLKEEGDKRNHRYCKSYNIWPIVTPKGEPMQEGDSHFSDLKKRP